MVFDSHCHLTEKAYPNPPEVVNRARENGVGLLLTVGLDREDCQAAVALAQANDGVYAGIGIHPHEADRFRPDDIGFLRELAKAPMVKAIGETGLDRFRNYARPENQQAAFRAHIALARELDLPLILHIRDAYPEALAVLREHGYYCGVMHCYSGDRVFALEAVRLGFYVSFSGSLTYSNARLPDVARALPAERILVETDAPYLSPVPLRGKFPNEPAFVRHTLAALARIRQTPVHEMARITTENAQRLFRISGTVPKSPPRKPGAVSSVVQTG
jgi:TatD DNase family protein